MILARLRIALFAYALFQLSSNSSVLASTDDDDDDDDVEIYYVMEPFEHINASAFDDTVEDAGGWFLSPGVNDAWKFTVRKTADLEGDDALFGDAALRIDYQLLLDEEDNSAAANGGNVELGWKQLPSGRPHNCHGATHLSLWYKVLPNSAPINRLRLVLLESGESNISEVNNDDDSSEEYYFDIDITQGRVSASEADWQEVRVNLLAGDVNGGSNLLQLYNSSSSTSSRGSNNGQLDLHRLRGWRVELSVTAQDESEEANNEIVVFPVSSSGSANGTILLDQLAFVGGGDLFGSSFFLGTGTWHDAVRNEAWFPDFFQSELSQNESKIVLEDGILSVDYTVEQVEAWGGYIALGMAAPNQAYYNLTNANFLQMGYRVRETATVPGRTHLRVILQDGSDACSNCYDWEKWYNFNFILDENPVLGQIQVPLKGSIDAAPDAFQLTGWSGGSGNRQLDTDHIKGLVCEFSLDSQGEIGSTVSGAIDLFDLSALASAKNPGDWVHAGVAVVESGLHFNEVSPRFNRREFQASQCEKTCDSDPTCLYALSNGKDCFTASHLEAVDLGISNTASLWDHYIAFWMDDFSKRGDFCEICECRESDRTIDCRDRDLNIIPKTFELPWNPQLLDLRNNPKLVMLGTGALEAISRSLQELWLPREMRYVSQGSLDGLTELRAVHIEELSGASHLNVIREPADAFGDVCCSRGKQIDLVLPTDGLTFCKMEVHRPGIDSRYLPFNIFDEAPYLSIVRPSSDFMSEAAESSEKCGEYCSISSECNYFTYDARKENAEHVCILQTANGTGPLEVCCEDDHYADEARTIPGYTAGIPPRTRHTIDNARVVVSPQNIIADSHNGYKAQFHVSLGSSPLRGAVWVEPMIASATDLDVTFWPPRVVLYDSNSTATVTVWVSASALKSGYNSINLVVHNKITSCDSAFTELSDGNVANRATTVFIDVVVPEIEADGITPAGIAAVTLGAMVVFGLAVFVYFESKRKKDDGMWMIKREELCFADPPEIVGRGCFGLVLKAEYRGTAVAVKRVIPPRKSTSNSADRFRLEEAPVSPVLASSCVVCPGISLEGMDSTDGTTSMHRSSVIVQPQALKKRRWWTSMETGEQALWKKHREDFVQEIRLLSKIRHPSITTVMGAIIGGKLEPMLVMELMDHGSLYDVLHNETIPLEAEATLSILRDISQGMRFLHAASPHQIIHGDLKAQNILVDSRFRAKVADFGLSPKKDSGITGTPYWLAPELLRGESTNTTASDVYAFGVVLCEVLSRREPYEGENPIETLILVADKAVNKRPNIPEHTPAPMQAVITDCFAGDPEQRPSFDELDQRLRRAEPTSLEAAMSGLQNSRAANISLFDIFPKDVAEALRDGRKVEATHRDLCTIFFSDIVGFTGISATLDPRKVADMLNRLYRKLDALSHKHDIYKVETIGDAYMAVSNLVKDQPHDHAKRIAEFAIDSIEAANSVEIDPDDPGRGVLSIRVGFHSGQVVADVVGTRNPRYCLFGDTVNTASRMESHGEKNRIHCSMESAALLDIQCPEMPLKPRGEIPVKGKGTMMTFFVNEGGSGLSDRLGVTAPTFDKASYIRQSLRRITEFDEDDLSLAENGLLDSKPRK